MAGWKPSLWSRGRNLFRGPSFRGPARVERLTAAWNNAVNSQNWSGMGEVEACLHEIIGSAPRVPFAARVNIAIDHVVSKVQAPSMFLEAAIKAGSHLRDATPLGHPIPPDMRPNPFAIVVSGEERGLRWTAVNAGTTFAHEMTKVGLLPHGARISYLPVLIPAEIAARLRPGDARLLAGMLWEAMLRTDPVTDMKALRKFIGGIFHLTAQESATLSDEPAGLDLSPDGIRKAASQPRPPGGFGARILFGLWTAPVVALTDVSEPEFNFAASCSYLPNPDVSRRVADASPLLANIFDGFLARPVTVTSIAPAWNEGIVNAVICDLLHQAANQAVQRGMRPVMEYAAAYFTVDDASGARIALRARGRDILIGPIVIPKETWVLAGPHIIRWLKQVTGSDYDIAASSPETFQSLLHA